MSIRFRVTTRLSRDVRAAAQAEGLSVSAWVRRAVLAPAIRSDAAARRRSRIRRRSKQEGS